MFNEMQRESKYMFSYDAALRNLQSTDIKIKILITWETVFIRLYTTRQDFWTPLYIIFETEKIVDNFPAVLSPRRTFFLYSPFLYDAPLHKFFEHPSA
jgi:hypothetical protein